MRFVTSVSDWTVVVGGFVSVVSIYRLVTTTAELR